MPTWFDPKNAVNGGLARPRRVGSVTPRAGGSAVDDGGAECGVVGMKAPGPECPDRTDPVESVLAEPGISPTVVANADLSFADVPRLALERLIDQLTDRAHDVLAAQGRLRGLLRANAAVVEELSLPVVLRHVVEGARELAHARYGALGVIGPDGHLEQFIHVGMDDPVVGRVIRSRTAELVRPSAAEFGQGIADDVLDGVGAVIGVPLPGPDATVRGALIVGRAGARAHFTEDDRDHLVQFAVHAGAALDLERAREDHETLLQIEDHDRIAADLHDHVIQELFATGMGLQSMLSQLTQPAQRARVLRYVDTLDDTIRTIRNTIYQLQMAPEKQTTIMSRLIAVLTEQTDTTDLALATEFGGPLEQLPIDLADDVVAVLREAVSNTVRHAGGSTVTVKVTFLAGILTVEVTDNGVGIGHPTRSSGLSNMRRRAENHAGALCHSTPLGGGTRLTWTARHPRSDAPHEAA
jgi:signal transduction histidine kinase